MDPISISEVAGIKKNFADFTDIILRIINTSVTTCQYPETETRAVIKPILKGGLDCQSLSSYIDQSQTYLFYQR